MPSSISKINIDKANCVVSVFSSRHVVTITGKRARHPLKGTWSEKF